MPLVRRWAGVLVALAVVGVVGGCVGDTDREQFEGVIRERGGGFVSGLPQGAVDAVAAEVGTGDFAIRRLSIDAANETVILDVRDPQTPENLDKYVVRGGEIDTIEPIRLSASDDLDRDTFGVSQLALDRIESMVDTALDEFDPNGGYVTAINVSQPSEGNIVFDLSLESERASATAEFTGAGELVEVVPT